MVSKLSVLLPEGKRDEEAAVQRTFHQRNSFIIC